MKTIQQYDEIRRVSEEQATNLVNSGWRYVPKSVWAALPGGILHVDRSSQLINDYSPPKNVVEARYIHLTYNDRKEDGTIIRR